MNLTIFKKIKIELKEKCIETSNLEINLKTNSPSISYNI